jgi:hypothetical protein
MAERPRRLSTSEYERPRKTSGTPFPTAGYAPGGVAGAYPSSYRTPSPMRGGYSERGARGASPYMGGGGLPPAHGVPVYPPGHIYAGKPIPGMQGDSLGTTGHGYGPPSPRREPLQLESPAGFTRPPSLAVPYTCAPRLFHFLPFVFLTSRILKTLIPSLSWPT